jgi:hypothetical protein
MVFIVRQMKAHVEGRKDQSLVLTLFPDHLLDSYEVFAALVAGRSPSDVTLLVARIRAANAAALNSDNRRKMQASRSHSVAAACCTLSTRHLTQMFICICSV